MQNGISANGSRTSIFVTTTESSPLIIVEYRTPGPSNHPQRRGRPVVAPNSFPRLRRSSSWSPAASVGNGPVPTRVVYAFVIPITECTCLGDIPNPVAAPPADALDDVTKGYVP